MIEELLADHVVRVDHVGIATESLARALPLYHQVMGGRFLLGGDLDERGMRTIQLVYPGGMKIELIEPTRPGSSLAPFLAEKGPGVHHVTVVVHDVVAAIADLEAQGYEVTGTRLARERWRETYVRPTSAGGVLLQIADTTLAWDTPVEGVSLDAVLAGEVVWDDFVPRLRAHVPVPVGEVV